MYKSIINSDQNSLSKAYNDDEMGYSMVLSVNNELDVFDLVDNTVKHYIKNNRQKLHGVLKGEIDDREIKFFGAECVRHVSKVLYHWANENKADFKLSMLIMFNLKSRVLICHVGQNSLYLNTGLAKLKITEEHVLSNLFERKGFLKDSSELPEEFSMPYRYLGDSEAIEVDCFILEIGRGDTLIVIDQQISSEITDQDKICEDYIKELNLGAALVIKFEDKIPNNPNVEICREILAQIPLFENMSYAQIHRFFSAMQVVDFEESELLKKDKANGLYIVLDGVLKRGSDLFERKDVLFAEALFKNVYFPEKMVLVKPGKVIYLSRFNFNKLMVEQPRTANRFMKNLIRGIL